MPEPDAPTSTSITKPTTLQLFIKARTTFRVEAAAITTFTGLIDQVAAAVVTQAVVLATAGDRTTLLKRDIEDAFKFVIGTPGVDPQTIFGELDKLTTDELAKVINLIQAWLDAKS